MRIIRKKVLAVLLCMAMALIMLVALPTAAHAANGSVTIDISTLNATTPDNSGDAATDSQWEYQDTGKILYLLTPDGQYTLEGTNTDLQIRVFTTAIDATVTLDNMTAFSLLAQGGCTFVLVGDNYLANGLNYGLQVSADVECAIKGSGTLSITTTGTSVGIIVGGTLPFTLSLAVLDIDESANVIVSSTNSGILCIGQVIIPIGLNASLDVSGGIGVDFDDNGSLSLICDGNARFIGTGAGPDGYGISSSLSVMVLRFDGTGSVRIEGSAGSSAIKTVSSNYLYMGEDITLELSNNSSSPDTHYFRPIDVMTGTHQWKLSGGASFVSPSVATDDFVYVSIAAGVISTISREPIPPTPPTITSANNFSCVTGTGGSFPLTATGTSPITWSLSGTVPAGVSISGSTLVVASTVPAGDYSFVIVASNVAQSDVTQQFTLNVTAADTGGNTGCNTGGNTSGTPATGDSTTLILLLGALLAAALGTGAVFTHRHRRQEDQ